MREIRTVCVFCGSSPGASPAYTIAARELGRHMALRGMTLVYGGSNIGLMSAIAEEMLKLGGRVIGVMPQGLIDMEVAHTGLQEFHVAASMSDRKEMMARLSDAFVAMPGGIGTLDELFEAMSWNQLSIMDKPVSLLNIDGYYDHLLKFMQHTVDEHFVRHEHLSNLIVETDAPTLLNKLESYQPIKVDSKWIDDLRVRTNNLK
jgi:hypothetical protein